MDGWPVTARRLYRLHGHYKQTEAVRHYFNEPGQASARHRRKPRQKQGRNPCTLRVCRLCEWGWTSLISRSWKLQC